MKKVLFMLFALSALVLVSCGEKVTISNTEATGASDAAWDATISFVAGEESFDIDKGAEAEEYTVKAEDDIVTIDKVVGRTVYEGGTAVEGSADWGTLDSVSWSDANYSTKYEVYWMQWYLDGYYWTASFWAMEFDLGLDNTGSPITYTAE